MYLFAAFGVFTNQFDIVAHTIDGEVASLSQSLEDIDLLVADRKHAWTVDLAKYSNLIVRHTDCDHGVLLGIQVGTDLVVDHLFTLLLGETSYIQCAQHRELDGAVVADQISLEGTIHSDVLTAQRGIKGC